MGQSFLVTAYKDYDSLLVLTQQLLDYGEVYIHIDRKSKSITEENLKCLNQIKGCKAFSKYSISWGSFSHVEAIIELMRHSLQDYAENYIHLITGEDMPVQSADKFVSKFNHSDKIYMDVIDPKDQSAKIKERYQYVNFFPNANVKNPFLWQVQQFTIGVQKLFKKPNQKIGQFETIYKGLVYVSLPSEVGKYILEICDKQDGFIKDLKRCQLPEEFLFQTIIMNSKYAKNVSNTNARYLNWERGNGASPAYIDESDYSKIVEGDYFFARKFHPSISKKLREMILENS